MSDDPVRTVVNTDAGPLPFQDYFVRQRCAPAVTGFEFDGIEEALPNPALVSALDDKPAAIVIAPSNPFVSVAPILAVPGMRDMLHECGAPVVAVSPIVAGGAIKGPAAKMMNEMGMPASVVEIARHYQGFIDALIIDEADAAEAPAIAAMGMEAEAARTIMKDLADRIELARRTVELATRLNGGIKR